MQFLPFLVFLVCTSEELAIEQVMEWRRDLSDRVTALTFSADGKYLLAGDGIGRVTLWEAATGKLVSRFQTACPVTAVALSPDGQRAITTRVLTVLAPTPGAPVGEIALREIPSGRLVKTLDSRKGAGGLSFSPDSKRLLTAGEGLLRMWDARDGRLLKTYTKSGRGACSVMFLRDGKRAFIDGKEHLAILDLEQQKVLRTFPYRVYPSRYRASERVAAFCANGRHAVLSGGDDLDLLDVTTGTRRTVVPVKQLSANSLMDFHPANRFAMVQISRDGKRILTASVQIPPGRIEFWEVATRGLVHCFPKGKVRNREIRGLALSPDGRWGVSGEAYHTLKVWDLTTGTVVRRMTGRLLRNPDEDEDP